MFNRYLNFIRFAVVFALLCHACPTRAGDDEAAAREYASLLAEYESEGGARVFAKRLLELSERYRSSPASADALTWVVKRVPGRRETDRALELLGQHHVKNATIGAACDAIARSRSAHAEGLLRAILAKNADPSAQALACFHLSQLLDREAEIIRQLAAEPELAPRVLQYYGSAYGEHLSSLKTVELTAKREEVYEALLRSFANVKVDEKTMGAIAKQRLFAIRHLAVGRVAPEIQGVGINEKQLRLSDYRGKVVMLSFWGHW